MMLYFLYCILCDGVQAKTTLCLTLKYYKCLGELDTFRNTNYLVGVCHQKLPTGGDTGGRFRRFGAASSLFEQMR